MFFLVKETDLACGAYALMFALIFFPIFTTKTLSNFIILEFMQCLDQGIEN